MMAHPSLVAFHTVAQVRAHQETRFVEWKRREGDVQAEAPGFVKRLVLKDLGQSGRYYYMSFWDREDALALLQHNPAFVALSAEYGVPLYIPSQRDGHTPSDADAGAIRAQANAHPLLAEPVQRFRANVQIDESSTQSGGSSESDEPYAFHYYVPTGTAGAAAFLAFKRAEAQFQLSAHGFVKRLLLGRADDPGAFVYFSHWVSRSAAHDFHALFVKTPEYRHFYGQLAPYVVPPTFSDCALVDDRGRRLESATV